jgi:hypothetical protein
VLGSFWFLFVDGRFWFNSRYETPLPKAIADGSQVAVIVDDFTPPDQIRQVRVRGPGSLEPHDPDRVQAIYRRYLGDRLEDWPRFFRDRCHDPAWGLWTASPATGLAVSSPQFGSREIRWNEGGESPLT